MLSSVCCIPELSFPEKHGDTHPFPQKKNQRGFKRYLSNIPICIFLFPIYSLNFLNMFFVLSHVILKMRIFLNTYACNLYSTLI